MAAEESLLAEVPLFQALDPAERAALAAGMRQREFSAGGRIFRRGDPGAALYVIARGTVEISVETTTGKKVVLGQLGPGDFFGELSLLDGRERTADALALEPTGAMEIDRGALEGLFCASGIVPRLAEDLSYRGSGIDPAVFKRTGR